MSSRTRWPGCDRVLGTALKSPASRAQEVGPRVMPRPQLGATTSHEEISMTIESAASGTPTPRTDIDTTELDAADNGKAFLLRGLCAGAVHLPGDPGYDEARMPWNVAVDQ